MVKFGENDARPLHAIGRVKQLFQTEVEALFYAEQRAALKRFSTETVNSDTSV